MNPNIRIRSIAKQVSKALTWDGTNSYLKHYHRYIPFVRDVMAEGYSDVHAEVMRRVHIQTHRRLN